MSRTAPASSVRIKPRYKPPTGDECRLIEVDHVDGGADTLSEASDHLRFAAAVAGSGMLPRDSPHKGNRTYESALESTPSAADRDPQGYRRQLLILLRKGQMLIE